VAHQSRREAKAKRENGPALEAARTAHIPKHIHQLLLESTTHERQGVISVGPNLLSAKNKNLISIV